LFQPGLAQAAPDAAPGKRGGTLVIGGALGLRHFNGAIQSGAATAIPGTQIFASPLRFDADWNPQPYLAKSWQVAPDGLSVTLHLVDNAVFHDGQPVTSADVAFTIGIIKANHPFQTMLAPVQGVDTPDPLTAVIRLAHPHPALILAMSPALMPILPKHIYGDGQDIQTHPANLKPIGSGPFRFVEYQANDHWVVERFDRFFLPDRPFLDRIVGRVIDDPSVVMLGIERAELHIVPMLSGVRDIDRAEKVATATVTPKGYEGIGAITWLAFNTQRKPLDDKRVRQAICFAADRDAILKRLMGGKAKAATGPIVSSSPFYNPDVELYPVNIDKANALLDAAGHPRGADGTRFPLVIDTPSGSPEQARNIAEFLRVQLRKIGIPAEVRLAPDFPTWAERISNFDFDLTTDNVFNWGDPVIGVHRTYLSTNIRKGVIWSNTQGYRNPRVDELLGQAALELDVGKRRALYAEFQRIVVDDAPIFFIDEVPYRSVFNKGEADPPETIWGPFSPYDGLYWDTAPT
jgi:peptide/nickel transport system substrate-binding protein